ncbi:hypothetical protein GCM10017778_30270 [Streptomyces vinaceus]|nr:hypothetical protein GCM10017778_30270 [Streptomyces vinaceus]
MGVRLSYRTGPCSSVIKGERCRNGDPSQPSYGAEAVVADWVVRERSGNGPLRRPAGGQAENALGVAGEDLTPGAEISAP